MSMYIYFKRELLLRVWVDVNIWGVNTHSLIYTLPQKKCNLNLPIFPRFCQVSFGEEYNLRYDFIANSSVEMEFYSFLIQAKTEFHPFIRKEHYPLINSLRTEHPLN